MERSASSMEDTTILRSLLQWFFPRGRVTLRIAFVWFVLVVIFAGYGFNHLGNQIKGGSFSIRSAVQGAMLTGALGVGIATCVTGGLMILANVQANRFGKGTAVLHAPSLALSRLLSVLFWRALYFQSHGTCLAAREPWE